MLTSLPVSWKFLVLSCCYRVCTLYNMLEFIYRGADKSLPLPGTNQVTATRFLFSYILFIIIIVGILVIFINITRLASNEIFSPSNKIHREVGQSKDLSAPR